MYVRSVVVLVMLSSFLKDTDPCHPSIQWQNRNYRSRIRYVAIDAYVAIEILYKPFHVLTNRSY